MTGELTGQVAVVTGGTAGIGRGIAKKFLEEGAQVVICGTNEERGVQAVEELSAYGSVRFQKVDVSEGKEAEALIKGVLENEGKLDVLVNNAGITRDNLLIRMKEEDWDQVMDVNLKSCYHLCRAAYRPMLKAKKGKIVNITSVVGIQGNAGQVNYAASKAGMIGLSQSLARELASRGITVNCVAPGFIETQMTHQLTDGQKEEIFRSIPMGRMGQVEEIADAVLFLASERSKYITGQVLTVDGGMVMS